jgi:hypothetical protein
MIRVFLCQTDGLTEYNLNTIGIGGKYDDTIF